MKPTKRLLVPLLAILLAIALPASALASDRIEKDLKLEPGGRFVLEADAGSVAISGSTEPGAHVVVTSKDADLEKRFQFGFEERPGEVRVTAKKLSKLDWGRSVSLHFEVRVPARTTVTVGTGGGSIDLSGLKSGADLKTSGGSITIADLEGKALAHTSGGRISLQDIAGDADIETSGGGIDVRSLRGSLKARTSGGAIGVEEISGDLDIETSGGSVHVAGAGGHVAARTSGGSMDVAFVKGNARGGTIETSAGSVRVVVDPAVGLDVEAGTSAGAVELGLPLKVAGTISRSSVSGKLGAGGAKLTVHTSAGSVRIDPL